MIIVPSYVPSGIDGVASIQKGIESLCSALHRLVCLVPSIQKGIESALPNIRYLRDTVQVSKKELRAKEIYMSIYSKCCLFGI